MQHKLTCVSKIAFIIISIFLFASKKEQAIQKEAVSAAGQQNIAAAVSIIVHSATPKQTDSLITKSGFGDVTQYAYLPKNSSSRKDHLLIIIPARLVYH